MSMERLTKRELIEPKIGKKIVGCNYKDEDCNDSCLVHVSCRWNDKALEKLKEYEDLEEQGLLIKLPCKCDEVVWAAEKGFLPHKALYSCQSAMLEDIEHGIGIGYTKEEAEAALKEMG